MRKALIFALLLCCIISQARKRDIADIADIATRVLPTPAKVHPVGNNKAAPRIKVMQQTDAYTVMGYTTGGFAVVANDDNVEAIIGYSTAAVYDSTNIPDGLRWWLTGIDNALRHSPRYERSSTAVYNTTGVDEVSPMITAKWGQEEPYSLQCPKKTTGKGHQVTGCVATAMAMIMNYWRYPEVGDGDDIYSIFYHLYVPYQDTHYDWDNMLNVYKDAEYTDTQSNAVAELMMHCGMAVGMKYDNKSSGAQGQYVPAAMRDHFRYHKNIGYRNRANHNDYEWMGNIYKELVAGRPILYMGQDNAMSYGHAFIIDGFDADGMVHVNWGWEGNYDGYFDINLLNSGYMGLEFVDKQAMIFGIGMPYDNIQHYVELALRKDLDLYLYSGKTYQLDLESLVLWNLNDYDLEGTLGIVMPIGDEVRPLVTIATFSKTNDTGVFQSFTYRSGTEFVPNQTRINLTIPSGLEDGTYHFYPAFKESGSSYWQPLWAAEGVVGSYVVFKNGTSYEVYGNDKQYIDPTVGIEDAKAHSCPYANGTYNLQGQRVNQSYHGVVIMNGRKTVI